MKRFMSIGLATILSVAMLSGCAPSTPAPSPSAAPAASQKAATPAPAATPASSAQASTAPTTKKEKVVYWAIHKGDEFAVLEKAVKKYNEASTKYEVEALSVTDKQKLIVSMASSDGPDLIGGTNQDLINYSAQSLIKPMDDLIARDKIDLKQFADSAQKANTIGGKFYGLPWHVTIIQMYYNKDILKAAGYEQPPKTMEELYDIAVKATKVDANGDIDTLGYPLFPLASNRFEGVYAFGGRWADDSGKPTPNTPEIRAAWDMNLKFRKQFGLEKVQKYVATANTNRYTPQDAFFAGKQLFRFDGPWLNTMIKANNPSLNYGIAMVPATKANPDNVGATRFETQNSAIPVTAKNAEGAWDLAKFFSLTNEKELVIGMGQLPALKSLYEDKDIQTIPGFSDFIKALSLDRGVPFAAMSDYSKYISLMDEAYDYMYNGKKTVEQALTDLEKEAKILE